MAAALGVSLCLGRTLGASGLGIINLASQTVTLLLVVTMFGMDNVLIKRIAIAYERGDQRQIGNSFYTSSVINGLLAGAITVLGAVLAPWLSRRVFHAPALEIPLIIFISVIVPQTFSRIFAAGLSGFRKIWQSSLVNDALSVWVVGIGLIVFFCAGIRTTVVSVAVLYAAGRLAVFASTGLYWRRLFRYSGPKQFIPGPMLTMALPLLVVSGTSVITSSADAVMLGWLGTSREVGLYSVAAKLALLESFFLIVSNSAISPKIASLFAEGKISDMEKMVKRTTLGLILIAVASLTIFVLFGHFILELWGSEFRGAYAILVVLGVGQFFNISTGCVGLLLIMCGHEKLQGYISVTFLTLNLFLNYLLIRAYGAVGAAAATALTIAGENVTKLAMAKWKVGILTTPFVGGYTGS